MELNQNRENIKGAVNMALYYEQQGHYYPRHPFTFNVIKEGSYWEIQWIFTEGFKEVQGGDIGEFLEVDKTDSFKTPISEDAEIKDLSDIVANALETIYKQEYTG